MFWYLLKDYVSLDIMKFSIKIVAIGLHVVDVNVCSFCKFKTNLAIFLP